MRILAFDIGGANTKKLVFEDGAAHSKLTYFPIWKRKNELISFLSSQREDADMTVVTMTAELSDVFTSKEEGTRFIVRSCEKAFKNPFFLTLERKLVRKDGIPNFRSLASANWQASLYLMEKRFDEGILIDVGSTTTDILPFGKDAKQGISDLERLKTFQLVYTGYLRTPVNAIVGEVPINGLMTPIASELFAITADVYNVLWGVTYTCETPDGREKTKEGSKRRLARLLCADLDEAEEHIQGICSHVHEVQVKRISEAINRVSKDAGSSEVYVAGVGKRLGLEAARELGFHTIDLEKRVKDAWNLPCLGLCEIALDMERC